jgi:DNA-binding NarL/FixJ family response regulator
MEKIISDKLEIWIVEDNKDFSNKLASLINLSNEFTCRYCFQSIEAILEVVEKEDPPDLILMDIGLPGKNGLEGIKIIHQIVPEVKFVILTVFEDADNIIRAISNGASGYLLKDASLESIIESLKSISNGGAPINPQIAKKILDLFSKNQPQTDYGLTPREKEVLGLLVEGLAKKQIAFKMSVSFHTVDKHLRNIYSKLQTPTRSLAIVKAIKENIFKS